jgi:molecular chaperone DnaK (HSP70)
MTDSKYIVGIDLGTSNSILAYTPAELDDPAAAEIKLLEIPQIPPGPCCRPSFFCREKKTCPRTH